MFSKVLLVGEDFLVFGCVLDFVKVLESNSGNVNWTECDLRRGIDGEVLLAKTLQQVLVLGYLWDESRGVTGLENGCGSAWVCTLCRNDNEADTFLVLTSYCFADVSLNSSVA